MSDKCKMGQDSRCDDTNSEIDRIAIVQLSDIHFQENSNVLTSRSEKIIAAIRPTLENVGGVVFAVTGDVACSGSQEEYRAAFDFFTGIKNRIQGSDAAMPVNFVFIPGNHDCDFRSAGDARPALLDALPTKIETLDPSGEIVRRMTEVQDNFFSFEAQFHVKGEIPTSDRLRYQTKLQLGRFRITFDCYNTAWMSQRDEQQGTLLFPVRLLAPEAINDDERDDLRVSLIHHRDNWLESNNARLLRDHKEIYSDIIFSGHEHVGTTYTKTKGDGTGPQYFEGAVLQDPKSPGNSGFNVLELDLHNGLRKISRFRWSGQRYSCETDGEWAKFERNSSLMRGQFQIAPSFLRLLRDPGAGFFHPGKPDLTLDVSKGGIPRRCRSSDFANFELVGGVGTRTGVSAPCLSG
jgi:predicted MPP superfamily phosphohydrolase